jgi:hypothetical protein
LKNFLSLSFLFFLVCLFSGNSVFSQYDDYVKKIRTNCDKINNDKSLVKVNTTDPSGVELTGYFMGNTLLKISSQAKTSWGLVNNDYYFDKDLLVYFYEQEKKNMPDPTTGTMGLSVNFTGGYYFLSNQVIRETNVVGLKQPLGKKETKPSPVKNAQQYGLLLKEKKE